MILKTFIKEIKEMIRDGRIRLSFLIVILLLGVTLWIRIGHYHNINEQYKTATVSEREVWDGQGEKTLILQHILAPTLLSPNIHYH